jgi:5'-phosphate synthase pdxT subunit
MNQTPSPIVGILDLQGDVIEHRRALEACGAEVMSVKTVEDLMRVEGLIIPGGESTTIGKLMEWYDLAEPIRKRVAEGMPIYGSCAGTILLAREIVGKETAKSLAVMDIEVERNSYGRQLDSFEDDVEMDGNKIPAVFIRAPRIKKLGQNVVPLAQCGPDVVLAREGNKLVSTFHPELTPDLTVHRYFLTLVHDARSN